MNKNNIIDAILISLSPKQCENIASGKQSIIVRKTKPKFDTPFKCYIYCTHDNRKNALHLYVNSGYGRKEFGVTGNWRSGKDVVDVNPHLPAYRYNAYLAEGKVIGEFMCDKIECFPVGSLACDDIEKQACLTYREIIDYFYKPNELDGNTLKFGYSWHISDFVIYDEPKELNEFSVEDTVSIKQCKYRFRTGQPEDVAKHGGWIKGTYICRKEVEPTWCTKCIMKQLNYIPKSWCYVKRLK